MLDVLKDPFQVEARNVYVRASLGIARASRGDTYDQLLRNADLAMYTAKRLGKNRFETYRAGTELDPLVKLDLETALRHGLDSNEFSVHYQPIVDLATGEMVGAEALARWHNAQHGTIIPATFIPLAEDMGLISELGQRVLLSACVQVREWQTDGLVPTAFSISVNLSTRQLDDHDLIEQVAYALQHSGLPAENLVLEITESGVMSDNDKNIRTLSDLRALGVRIAIDDFGTGYSSLSYLQHFPVDILKIDRSFVSASKPGRLTRPSPPPSSRSPTHSTSGSSRKAWKPSSKPKHSTPLGCELAQGYYFAHPVDSDTMRKILIAHADQHAPARPRPHPPRSHADHEFRGGPGVRGRTGSSGRRRGGWCRRVARRCRA